LTKSENEIGKSVTATRLKKQAWTGNFKYVTASLKFTVSKNVAKVDGATLSEGFLVTVLRRLLC